MAPGTLYLSSWKTHFSKCATTFNIALSWPERIDKCVTSRSKHLLLEADATEKINTSTHSGEKHYKKYRLTEGSSADNCRKSTSWHWWHQNQIYHINQNHGISQNLSLETSHFSFILQFHSVRCMEKHFSLWLDNHKITIIEWIFDIDCYEKIE